MDADGIPALHLASGAGHTGIIRLLLDQGVDIQTADKAGRTALHYSAIYGTEAVVEMLLNRGADIQKTDEAGRTARHYLEEQREMTTVENPM